MSASSKKKLRNELNAAKMTEKQLAEQAEAKKLKTYTRIFVVVLIAIVAFAIYAGASQFISNNGILEKNTVALTVNGHKISNAELTYYYIDEINSFYNNYGSYISLFGLDVTKPLDEQVYDEEAGTTWADDFVSSAMDSAKSTYLLADAAAEAGYTLSEADQATVDSVISNISAYAYIYGYDSADGYLKAMYGKGADEAGYRAYYEMNLLASAYYEVYAEGLTYDAAALQAAYDEAPAEYASYTYSYYYLTASSFREGGTTDENGTTTYSDEEKAAAVAAAEEAAKALTAEEIRTLSDLDKAIAALEINEGSTAAATVCEDYAYDSVSSVIREWVVDTDRKSGDLTYIPSTSTSTDADGNEAVTTNGYYVVFFTDVNDNTFALKNVRHILVSFEGGTYDDTTGTTTYSDEEKAAAKEEAEALLAEFLAGEATEEAFAALANEKSDDGDGTTGGLYENIYPGQMVEPFETWCYEAHAHGDTGIVESTFGYYIMFFVSDSDMNYRDFQIDSELRSHDTSHWYSHLLEDAAVTEGDIKYINKSLVLSSN